MKFEDCRDQGALGPDFAHRVVERVRKAKRRRRLYQWALASTVGCALAAVTILMLWTRNSATQPSRRLASRSDSPTGQVVAYEYGASPEPDPPPFHQPLVFFFPNSDAVEGFHSSEANYWHSYDPWWDLN